MVFQIHSILKEKGEIVQSIPDIDDLHLDVFYKEVNFLLLTDKSKDEIKNSINISDVTDLVDIIDYDGDVVSEEKKIELPEKIILTQQELRYVQQEMLKEQSVYNVTVFFDESNPMRSVSGVLFFYYVKINRRNY